MRKHNRSNAVAIGILLAITAVGFAQEGKKSGEIYAYLNDIPIFKSAILREYRRFIPSFHGKKYLVPRESQERYMKKAIKAALEKEMACREAMRQKLKITEEELKMAVHVIEMQKQLWEGLEKYLQSQGRDYGEFLSQLKRELLVAKFLQREVTGKVKVDKQEIEDYYRRNKKTYYLPEQINIQLISVRVDLAWDKEKKEKARKKAQTVYNLVKKGRDFYFMAETYSDDPWRVKGGEFGYKHHGQIEETIEKQALALKLDEISEVFQSDYGYHVVKLLGKKPARQLPLREVRDKIKGILLQKATQNRTNCLYRDLERKYRIEPKKVRKIFFEGRDLD